MSTQISDTTNIQIKKKWFEEIKREMEDIYPNLTDIRRWQRNVDKYTALSIQMHYTKPQRNRFKSIAAMYRRSIFNQQK
jgi:hypothetical protein